MGDLEIPAGESRPEQGFSDIVVLGGGPAGVTAALRAAALGASVTLIEADRLGGVCTDDGCAPTRVLAHAARLMREAGQYAAYGLAGRAPRLDFEQLMAQTQATVYRIHEKKQLAAQLEAAGVRVIEQLGPAHFVDGHTVELASGARIGAQRFILCVGGHARRLSFPGSELALTHSDVWQLRTLPARLAIVGSAATGSQLASIFAAFGSRVTLLELAPRILPAEDELISDAMGAAFAEGGISIQTGIGGLRSLKAVGQEQRLEYAVGEHPRSLEVDAVILAVGWTGNVEALRLEACGVTTERGYVSVGPDLRTTAEHVYAAGDVTGRMMLVQTAIADGRLAAEKAVGPQSQNAVGAQSQYADGEAGRSVVPHGGFTDPEYGSVGLTEKLAAQREPIAVGVVPYADLDRGFIDGRTVGAAKLVVSRATRRLLGAHVVGEQAVEVVQVVAAAMAAGLRVDELAQLRLAYPTYTAILGLAARDVLRQLDAGTGGSPHEWEWGDPALPPRFRNDFGTAEG